MSDDNDDSLPSWHSQPFLVPGHCGRFPSSIEADEPQEDFLQAAVQGVTRRSKYPARLSRLNKSIQLTPNGESGKQLEASAFGRTRLLV